MKVSEQFTHLSSSQAIGLDVLANSYKKRRKSETSGMETQKSDSDRTRINKKIGEVVVGLAAIAAVVVYERPAIIAQPTQIGDILGDISSAVSGSASEPVIDLSCSANCSSDDMLEWSCNSDSSSIFDGSCSSSDGSESSCATF